MVTEPRVEVLGIRHHGPGSARSVAAALDELSPDLLLIEGPPELDTLVDSVADPDLVPPVAGLVYAVDEPRRASFYPLAAFSPEWIALRWAVGRGVPARFADLPATHALAHTPAVAAIEDEDQDADALPEGPDAGPDVIGELARAVGYDDPERWWEDAVEHRYDTAVADFAHLRDAVALVRTTMHAESDEENLRREAAMRRVVRAAIKGGAQRIAVVCGAFHAPALDPTSYPSATADNRLLAKLPRVKVTATWAPWTSGRLARRSGYGAGVASPGWYQHLYRTWADDPAAVGASWLVRVARELRTEQLLAPPAGVVEATRLADALAAVRGRPSVGLAELNDATQAVLCDGSPLPLRLVDEHLVIGHDLGRVPDSAPLVPLAADLARTQRRLRLKPSAAVTTMTLDLRKEAQLARSVLFHRLLLLDIPWGRPADTGRTSGTFKEAWEVVWEPELAVALIEASGHGTTLVGAAEQVVREAAGSSETTLADLSSRLEQCLLADLPEALRDVVAAVADRTARHSDVPALLSTLGPLARTLRYGDVRGVDLAGLAHVVETIVIRSAVGLRASCASLDDEAAAQMRESIETGDAAIALLDIEDLRTPWQAALARVGDDERVHGSVAGRVNRMLLDAGRLSAEDAGRRLSRQLSIAVDAGQAAAWLDGFLAGEALLLLHEEELLGVVDGWVAEIADETFDDLLPLLRRTFSRFEAGERRNLGRAVRDIGSGRSEHPDTSIDLQRGRPALLRVADLLGLEVSS
ncbi:DUF5682 family protein [Gordonia sinesedis]